MTANIPTASVPVGDIRPRYLRRVDLRATVTIAALFNAILGVALTLAGWIVIGIAAQRGVFDQVNSVTSDLGNGHPMQVGALRLCIVWALIVAAWSLAMTVVVGLATFVFNHVLQVLGGIELDLRDTPPPKADVESMVRRTAMALRDRLQPTPQPALDRHARP